jgi:hypothetical protein
MFMKAGDASIRSFISKERLLDDYERWLLRFTWSIWGTLTFRGSPSTSKATRVFDGWISEIRKLDGKKGFRWVRVTEMGAFGDNVHFHILLGGLRDGSKFPWMLRWEKLAGTAELHYFDSSLGGLRYLLKSVEPGKDFAIDFSLPPQEKGAL